MKAITCTWAVAILCTVCNAQFFYNDEQHQSGVQESSIPDNTYSYDNPPDVQPIAQPPPRAATPVYEQRPKPNRGRRRQNGQRQWEPVQSPPRVYGPSVFENLDLGVAPTGVYVPDNSFLNVLRNNGQNLRTRQNEVYEPPAPPPPPRRTSFEEQSPASQSFHTSVHSDQPYSIERPTIHQRAQVIAAPPAGIHQQPQTERTQSHLRPNPAQNRAPPPQYQAPPPQHTEPPVQYAPQPSQYQAPPAPVQVPLNRQRSGRAQNRAPPPQYQAPPPQHREPPVQYAPPPSQYQAPPAPAQVPLNPQRSGRRRSGPRHRPVPSYEEPQRPPQIYSPSVFEKLDLGVAPSGIHVPEDSLLNILRSDTPNSRPRRNQNYQPPPPPVQHAPIQYSDNSHSAAQPELTEYEDPQVVQIAQQPTRRISRAPQQQIPETVPKRISRAPQQQIPQPVPRRVSRTPQQQIQEPVPRRVSRVPQQEITQPEVVDSAENYQDAEEHPPVEQQPKPVQNRRTAAVRRQRQYASSRSTDQVEFNEPPKQFAPSVFEKIKLGEAPPGIYIPEDSFLNLLRGEGQVTRPAQRSATSAQHSPAPPPPPPLPPRRTDIPAAQIPPDSEYETQEEDYSRQDRRSHMTYANQLPPQQQQNIPLQNYQQSSNAQPQTEHQRTVPQEIHRPSAPPRQVQQRRRERQRSRTQPVSVRQPIYEAPKPVYNAGIDLKQEYDIMSQRARRQEVPQHQRVDVAPRYVPPSQPVYETPQPTYNVDPHVLEDDDIPRLRRVKPTNQRRTQVQQPAQPQPVHSPQHRRNEEVPEPRQQSRFTPAKLSVKALPDDTDGDQIPGEAGVDYPTLHVIPRTSFSCTQQAHNGYYADLDTACQVVHMCQAGGVQSSFLCPNGTIFNQEKFSCQWWYKVNCADAPSHYSVNDKLYKVPAPPAPAPPARRREE